MSNYIKAELYRITRGRSVLAYILFGFMPLTLVFGTFMSDPLHPSYKVAAGSFPIMACMMTMYAGSLLGKHYTNRTAHYEIMDGANVHKLIWYRIIVYTSLLTVLYFIPLSLIMLIYSHNMKTIMAIALLYIVFLRMTMFVIGISMTIKTGEGIVLAYVRIILENIVSILGLSSNEDAVISMSDTAVAIFGWFPATECTLVANGYLSGELVVKALVGFIIEFAIMYALAYTSHKRKWYVRTTIGGHV